MSFIPYLSRRDFIKVAGVSATLASFPQIAQANTAAFPAGFKWGVGSAAAQVESRKGRGRSNWDEFVDAGNHIADGTNNIINTDFENRYREDFQLLADAGVQSFRFSFAWPRIQPEGPESLNSAGLDLYDRIIDSMLELGIEPFGTMIHWDIPVWAGDFRDRDIAFHMADYADIITERFGDRVTMWALLNEPNSVAMAGYGLGIHAPGLHAANAVGAAIHHQNLGQGLMAQAARANLKDNATLTTTINLTPIRAAVGEQPQDEAVVELVDAYWNRAFMDPLYDKGYPVAISPNVEPYVQGSDMDIIALKPETIGVNYYSRLYVRANPDAPLGFVPDLDGAPQEVPRTGFYFFEPDGLPEILMRVHNEYGAPKIYITETGFALADDQPKDGLLNDPLRSKYIKSYLDSALTAIEEGVDLKGIYYWSATDNWEWAEGFAKRFGLISFDPETLERTPKSSLLYYGQCAKANAALEPSEIGQKNG
ncbi:MAG TPA: family 1 glycosylhydrolase [Paenalcaligenes sp.]|nr:family 1 glycosylhydrolase [Paenalcaligenes sp.]